MAITLIGGVNLTQAARQPVHKYESKNVKYALAIIFIALASYWIFRSINANSLQFLFWEVLIPLTPFPVVFWLLGKGKKWEEFIGSGQLLPWTITISAIDLRRMFLNTLPQGFFVLGIIMLTVSSITFGVATYGHPEMDDNALQIKIFNARASIAIAVATLLIGVFVSSNSINM